MSDFTILADLLDEHFKSPFLLIYAYPHFMGHHGQTLQNYLISILKTSKNKNLVEVVKFHGAHHFHMIEAEKTANLILNFLRKENFSLNHKL